MSILNDVRARIAELGGSELATKEDMPALQELWEKMQELRVEMYEVKKKAAEDAAAPYMEAIAEIEKRYAFLLRMTS